MSHEYDNIPNGPKPWEIFKEYFKNYPHAPLVFKLRNFNTITTTNPRTGITSSELTCWILASKTTNVEADDIYVNNCKLQEILPEKIFNELVNIQTKNNAVYFKDIVKLGPQIALQTGRNISFERQYGSGDPDMAEYEYFGPFFAGEENIDKNKSTVLEQLALSVGMDYFAAIYPEQLMIPKEDTNIKHTNFSSN